MKKSMSTLLAGLMVIMTIAAGCDDPFNASSDPVGSPSGSRSLISGVGINPTRDTVGCVTAIGILEQDSYLTLYTLNSEVKYDRGSVLIPTPVSFSICDLDTTGTTFISRTMAFGENSSVIFLRPLKVKVDPVDVGLPENISNGTTYFLYRKNDNTGGWDLALPSKIKNHKLEYEILLNGVYAVSLDTTWISSGLIGTGGGTVSVRTATISFPPGALTDTATISFRLSVSTPVDLPAALDRVYEFGPEGLVFQTPVTLYVPFVEAGITDGKVHPWRLYYHDESSNSWVPQPTSFDWANQRIVVRLSHFSRYAFAR